MRSTDDRSDALVPIRDLGLAAALISVGLHIEDRRRDERSRVFFLFADSDDLRKAIDDYWSNELDVSALAFSEALKSLKNIIYGDKGR